MKPILNLALKSEYSFKQTYAPIERLIDECNNGVGAIGIADGNNTFAHPYLEKICKEKGLNPIFGVRLMVVEKPEERVRSRSGPEYIFIAKNNAGFKEMNELVKTSFDKFYYKAMIGVDDMLSVSENIFVISECPATFDRLDYLGLSPSTPPMLRDIDFPKVALQSNRYINALDKKTYQLLAGARKAGTGYNFLYNSQTYPQHVLSTSEWMRLLGDEEAIENGYKIASQCEVSIPSAPMVKYEGEHESIEDLALKGAKSLGIDIVSDGPYRERYLWEINLIKDKDFVDYFLIVADMILKAKKTMLVGPARGSAAGSLVCYLLGITTVDPLKFGLLFERFIDINRLDMPDIDVDFPDTKRQKVIKDLIKKFKSSNVCHIANVNKLKAKSAIGEVAMALSIPKWEVDLVKEAIVDRSGGDARAKMAAFDTLNGTDVGKEFLEKWPEAKRIFDLEGHSTHAGKHAAGIIVCNDEITKFGGVNSREGIIMMDKRVAEAKNLLKIDALGLRTLSILEECADQIGMDYLDYYNLPLDDEKTFEIFNDMRLSAIFQFEGRAMQMLCEKMGCETFDDIVALTALARPGPLHSGGAAKFISRRIGDDPVEYISDHESYVQCTKETYGIIIYQEQLMEICRICGSMNFEEVAAIRKGSSKTLGKEFFQKYFESFKKGARKNGFTDSELTEIWENMVTFGSWGMNKSHTVSYGYISYWCAYMKAHHPLEFAAANLNHAKSEESAINILRDALENDGIEYTPVDPDLSDINWSAREGKLVGGLRNIHGIGEVKAKEIIKKRNGAKNYTPADLRKLMDPKTPYDILYPTDHFFGNYYTDYQSFGLPYRPSYIDDIKEAGEFFLIGRVNSKELRDLNEYNELMKRGGKVWTENNKDLRLILEDDTNQILCKITRFDFDRMGGSGIYEKLSEGKSYVIVRGEMKEGWRMIYIRAIFEIGKVDKLDGLIE